MRIVCPNCHAQYEIDAALLPPEGREVQCSACGTVWFQTASGPAKSEPDPDDTPSEDAEPDDMPLDEDAPLDDRDADAPHDEAEANLPDPQDAPEVDDPEEDEEQDGQPPAMSAPPKPVDEKVLGILREEAAYESQKRAQDSSGLETQPELGLLGAAPWPSSAAREKEPARADLTQTATSSARSPAFPDIDDISASLEPKNRSRKYAPAATESHAAADEAQAAGGFMRGLIWPIAIACILVALYLAAPALSRMIPALTPVMAGYVMVVDGLREGIAGVFGR